MSKVNELRGSIVAGLDYQSDDWDMGQGEEGAATRAHEKKVDDLIAAVKAEVTEGAVVKMAEWRRGYNQGWEERKAFDLHGGAVDNCGKEAGQ